MVKNIVFDIGRVLVDYDWESYLDSFGFSPEVRARVAAAVFQNKDWGELDRGAIPEEEVLARLSQKRRRWRQRSARSGIMCLRRFMNGPIRPGGYRH